MRNNVEHKEAAAIKGNRIGDKVSVYFVSTRFFHVGESNSAK